MKNTDFEQKLEELQLTKKDFTNLIGMPYQTLMNWKQSDQTPKWVESWLQNYEKARKFEEILKILKPFV